MKLKVLIAFVLLIGFYGGFFLDNILGFDGELEARIEWVLPNMIRARDYHQSAVDNPELYDHDVVANNDAGWVIIYDEVISILKEIK